MYRRDDGHLSDNTYEANDYISALVAPDRLAAPGDAPTHHEHDHRRRRSTWQVSMIKKI